MPSVVTSETGTTAPPADSVQPAKKAKKEKEDPNYLSVKSAKNQKIPEKKSPSPTRQPNSFTPAQIEGIKDRKSAGKTDGVETLEKEGSFARIRCDRRYSFADFANEMLAFFTDRANCLNGYRHKKMKEAFKLFDKDGDGWIAAKELGTVMRALGQNPTETEIQDIVHECDVDGNGRLEFKEFVTMMAIFMKTPREMEDELKQAFRIFDTNNDGFINATEMRTMMAAMGEQLTNAEIDAVIKQWDSDGDGRINYNVHWKNVRNSMNH